jgi:hypothetical protein
MVIRRKGTEWGFPSASGRNEPLSAPLAPVNHPFTRFTHPSSSSLHASTIMSLAGLTASSSNLQPVFNNALQAYERQTKIVLLAHPLAAQLQSCADSPDAILLLLRGQVRELDQSRHGNDKWTKWLDPTVKVIGAFSMALGERVSLVCLETSTTMRSTSHITSKGYLTGENNFYRGRRAAFCACL